MVRAKGTTGPTVRGEVVPAPIPDDVLRRIRIPFVHRAVLSHGEAAESLFILDLGLLGAYVERSGPLPVGTPATLEFKIPGNAHPIRAGCVVAWRHDPPPRGTPADIPAGVGFQFVKMTEADRARLERYFRAYVEDPRRRRFRRPWPAAEGA